MDKFVPSEIKDQAVKNGTWFSSINSAKPIFLVLVVSVVLAGIAVSNHCASSCHIF